MDDKTVDPRESNVTEFSRRKFLGMSIGVTSAIAASGSLLAGSGSTQTSLIGLLALSASPTVSYVLRRREDQLWLRFDFYNAQVNGQGQLQVVDPVSEAVMVIGFPPQTINELATPQSQLVYRSNGSWHVSSAPVPKSALAGVGAQPIWTQSDAQGGTNIERDWSRLAFTIPPSILPLAFTDDNVMDWATRALQLGFQPRLSSAATEMGQYAPSLIRRALSSARPSSSAKKTVVPVVAQGLSTTQTAIELPWWLLISPNQWAGWYPSPRPTGGDHIELWHLRLGVLRQNAENLVDTSNPSGRTVRAVMARDSQANVDPFATASGADAESLTKINRAGIVGNTARPSSLVVKPTQTAPVTVNNLMLSPLGGWLDVEADWSNFKKPSNGLIGWRHRATMGRDHYVKVVNVGYLLPFGHKVSQVTISERMTWPTGNAKKPEALVVQRTYLDVTQPVCQLGSSNSNAPSRMPFTSVELKTKQTPDLQAPVAFATPSPQPAQGASPYFPRLLSGDLFEFKAVGTDLAGVDHEFSMPMAFVPSVTTANTLGAFIQHSYGFRTSPTSNGAGGVATTDTKGKLQPFGLPFLGGHDPSTWEDHTKVRALTLRGGNVKLINQPAGAPTPQPGSGTVTPDYTSVAVRMMVLDFDATAAQKAFAKMVPGNPGKDLVTNFVSAVIPGVKLFTAELDSVGALAGADSVIGAFEYATNYLGLGSLVSNTFFSGTFATAVTDAPHLLLSVLQAGAGSLLSDPSVQTLLAGAEDFAASVEASVLKAAGDRLGGFASPNSAIIGLSSVLGSLQGPISPQAYLTSVRALYDNCVAWEKNVLGHPLDWATQGFPLPDVPNMLKGPLNTAKTDLKPLLKSAEGIYGSSLSILSNDIQNLGFVAAKTASDLKQKAETFLSDGLDSASRYGQDLVGGVDSLLSGSILGGPSIKDLIDDTSHVVQNVDNAIQSLTPKGMTIERVKDNSLDKLASALKTQSIKANSDAQTALKAIQAGGTPDKATIDKVQAYVKQAQGIPAQVVDDIGAFSLKDALKLHYRLTWVPAIPYVNDDKSNGAKLGAVNSHLPFVTYLDTTPAADTTQRNDQDKSTWTSFNLKAESILSLTDPSSSTYSTRAEIKNLTLRIPTADTELVRVPVKSFVFTAGKGQQAHFDPSFGAIELKGALKFVQELASLAKTNGFSIKVGTNGVVAAFATDIPSLSVGVFALSNMSFGAKATIPFDGSPARMDLNFCTKEKPFSLVIYTFAGGGYFSLTASFRGIEHFDASFEFGAQVGFDIAGIVKGSIFIKGGIHYSYDIKNKSVFHAFVHMGGTAKVMAIASASIDLALDLGYETVSNKWTGSATLSIAVSVLFFSFSDSFEVHRSLGGNDPGFADEYVSPSLYSQYCGAFA